MILQAGPLCGSDVDTAPLQMQLVVLPDICTPIKKDLTTVEEVARLKESSTHSTRCNKSFVMDQVRTQQSSESNIANHINLVTGTTTFAALFFLAVYIAHFVSLCIRKVHIGQPVFQKQFEQWSPTKTGQ